MRMIDILPEHVREWVDRPEGRGSEAADDPRTSFIVLSAIFTTALNDQVTVAAPVQGRQDPAGPGQPRTIITPEQFAERVRVPAGCAVPAAGGDRRSRAACAGVS